MNITETKAAIKAMGFLVTYDRDDTEWRIARPLAFYGNVKALQENEAYYTNDNQDAYDTAKYWHSTL